MSVANARYTGIRVGMPERTDADVANRSYTPHECRLRDLTYSANIFVDVEYTRGKQIVKRKNVNIGRLPVMLRSSHCVLRGKSEAELARMRECPLDPGMFQSFSVILALLIRDNRRLFCRQGYRKSHSCARTVVQKSYHCGC